MREHLALTNKNNFWNPRHLGKISLIVRSVESAAPCVLYSFLSSPAVLLLLLYHYDDDRPAIRLGWVHFRRVGKWKCVFWIYFECVASFAAWFIVSLGRL